MPNVTRDDIYLDQSCATCGETIIIIPAHGFFIQHEDADLEADHRVTRITEYGTASRSADNPDSVKSTDGKETATCRHCGRIITREDGAWVDLDATGDDAVWRETCDSHDTFTAEHEPDEPGSVKSNASDATKAALLLAGDAMNRLGLLAHADPGVKPELAAKINNWQQHLSSCDWPILGYDTSDPPATGSVKTWTYSQLNRGGADVTHGLTFEGTATSGPSIWPT